MIEEIETGKESRKESDLMQNQKRQNRKACTRADKIRQLSDSELRDYLCKLLDDFCWNGCVYYDDCCNPVPGTGIPDCEEGIKLYLQGVVRDDA